MANNKIPIHNVLIETCCYGLLCGLFVWLTLWICYQALGTSEFGLNPFPIKFIEFVITFIILCLLANLVRIYKRVAIEKIIVSMKLGLSLFAILYLFSLVESIYLSSLLCSKWWECFQPTFDFSKWFLILITIIVFSLLYIPLKSLLRRVWIKN